MIRKIEPSIPSLRRYARALVRDAAEADDLVQDCLERAIGRWDQRRPDGDPRGWLFSILHNLAVSRWRRLKRRGPHLALDAVGEAELALSAAQGGDVRQAELLRALDALPEDQRAVLLLVGVEDLTYAQAAGVLGVPVGTVMSRLSRARERLAAVLNVAEPAARPVTRPALRRVK
jgi:RNA polymerase sigma-70 factor (ECF subfamily)